MFLKLKSWQKKLSRLFLYSRQINKWLVRIGLAFLAALFSAGVSLALTETRVNTLPSDGESVINQEEFKQSSIPVTQLSVGNPEQLLEQGRKFFQDEQFSQALEVWQQAVSGFQSAGDKLNEAQALSYLSLAYQQLGKLKEAENAIASSISLIRKSGESNGNSGLILAQAFNSQGHLQLALGQPESALSSWQEAGAIYTKIGDGEGAIGSQINQAQALQYMGLYRRARKTLEEVEKSLANQPNSLVKATGLRSLGNALRVIGELSDSRKFLQQSLTIAQQLKSAPAISAAQFSLANTARAIANKAEGNAAKKEIVFALAAYQEAANTAASPISRIQAQLNQLSLLVENEQFAAAEILRSQIAINELPTNRRSIYAKINLAQTLTKIAENQTQLANSQTAINYHREAANLLASAVKESRNIKDLQAESYALGNLGRLYELTAQTPTSQTINQQALDLTEKALILAQSISASDIAYRWEWQLGRLLKAQGDPKGAIKAYNAAVETLKSIRSDLVAINPDNPDVQFSFRESVEPVYRELVELLISTESQPSPETLLQAREVIESLQIAELDNFFQEACLDAKPVQIDQVDTTAVVIYPIILKERLAVIVAFHNSYLRLYSTIKSQKEIEGILDNLQQDIGRIDANNKEVLANLQQVYDWIIRPAEADLKQNNAETLVFVLDGLLRNIPMAALHDGQQYLVEKYSIAITPGLQLLPPQPLAQKQFKVLTAGLSEARQGFSPLPNVDRELTEITAKVSGEKLFNENFTNEKLQEALNVVAFPVVHIATHGKFSSLAEKTFILTWDNEINVKQLDSLLRRRQQEESRPIELLVLSACETADGDDRAALGLAGVAVRAGARSTLATLWRVNDDSTATLMENFYQELVTSKLSKAEALAQAQRTLLKVTRFRNNPYFWAPYVLVGNWR